MADFMLSCTLIINFAKLRNFASSKFKIIHRTYNKSSVTILNDLNIHLNSEFFILVRQYLTINYKFIYKIIK